MLQIRLLKFTKAEQYTEILFSINILCVYVNLSNKVTFIRMCLERRKIHSSHFPD